MLWDQLVFGNIDDQFHFGKLLEKVLWRHRLDHLGGRGCHALAIDDDGTMDTLFVHPLKVAADRLYTDTGVLGKEDKELI